MSGVELVKRVNSVTGVVIRVTEEFAETLESEWVVPDAAPEEAAEAPAPAPKRTRAKTRG